MAVLTLDRLIDRTLPAAPLLLLAASAIVLGTAYLFQYGLGIQPCKLCLYQRLPWWGLGGLASALIMARGRAGWVRPGLFLCALLLAANAALAGYHVGVEQAWWAGPSSCSAPPGGGAMTFEELKSQILSGPVVRCDKIPWQLFGVSMAGYNLLLSLGVAAFAAAAAFRPAAGRRP